MTRAIVALPPRIPQADLKCGDILLYRHLRQSKMQAEISRKTASPYTHAAIYLGDGLILDAVLPKVRKISVTHTIDRNTTIGVLRSQTPFTDCKKLNEFADILIKGKSKYDFLGVFNVIKQRKLLDENMLKIVNENYEKSILDEKYEKSAYFCSGLVVACYCVAGPIGSSARIIYNPAAYAPGHLYKQPTFGWVLGYLDEGSLDTPDDDPLQFETRWDAQSAPHWWS